MPLHHTSQPSDSAAVRGGVVAPVLAVLLVTVIARVVVFVAVRRHKRTDNTFWVIVTAYIHTLTSTSSLQLGTLLTLLLLT